MQLSDRFARARKYFRKYGLRRTVWRIFALLKQRLLFRRQVVLWLDLSAWNPDRLSDANMFSVGGIHNETQLPRDLCARLRQEHAEELIDRNLKRRFSKGATLWFLKQGTEFFGYIWTIPSSTLRPYFFPLTARDVHAFDDFIFPAYRGMRLNSLLMTHVLAALKAAGYQRVYMETGEWNNAELRSLDRVGLERLGYATRRSKRKTIVVTWWSSAAPTTAEAAAEPPKQWPRAQG